MRSPTPRITSAPSCSSTPAPERPQRVERRLGVVGVQVVAHRDRLVAHRPEQRGAVRDRLVGRRADRAAQRPRRARSGRSLMCRAPPGSRGPRSAPRRASAASSPATQSVIAPERMSGAGESAMSAMLTPAFPSASATCATIPGRFGTDTRSSWTGRRRARPRAAAGGRRARRSIQLSSARGVAAPAATLPRPCRRADGVVELAAIASRLDR